jgi:aminoacyl tRNA synthase complex-interacting multifunctional protein 1
MSGLVLVVANLKPRKLAGFESNGMVMAASNQDHTAVELLRPTAGSQVGERVYLEGGKEFEGGSLEKLLPVLNPKHKILEKVLPGLKTNEEGEATFNGKKLVTKSGVIKAETLKNSNIS